MVSLLSFSLSDREVGKVQHAGDLACSLCNYRLVSYSLGQGCPGTGKLLEWRSSAVVCLSPFSIRENEVNLEWWSGADTYTGHREFWKQQINE